MNLRYLLMGLFCPYVLQAHASTDPVPGQDYQSVQIASSKSLPAMEALYQRYTHLPYLRLEKRGAQYVLRAGFWGSTSQARSALERASVQGGQLRTAVLRPEMLVRQNWMETPSGPTSAAPPTAPIATPTFPNPNLSPRATSEKLRTFNEDDFVFAFDVFLSTGDLRSAFQLAQQAVAAVPRDRHWRRKLAQVAVWVQRPEVAAEQWRALFQQGDREPNTLKNVLLYSSQMEDLSIALDVWKIQARQNPLSPAQWEEVLKLFQEASQPAEGSRFFEELYQKTENIRLLEYAAELAGNAGDDERALKLNLQRSALEPFSMDAVLRAVVLLIKANRLPQALEVMQTYQAKVPAEAAEYWEILGEIAWDANSLETAQTAYKNYAPSAKSTADDWSRLVFLVRQKHPLQAADFATQAYRRFGLQGQLNQALEIYTAAGDTAAQKRLYMSLQGDALRQAETDQRFLLLRAQYHQASKQPDLAWFDLQRALKVDPNDKDTVLSTLWFLIDQGRKADLSSLLVQYAEQAQDPSYWQVYAVGNQVLGRQREAQRWYVRAIERTPDAPLLLLNYADIVENLQQPGKAATLRRHAWLLLRQKYPAPVVVPTPENASDLRVVVRLALANRPGDPALQQVREMAQKLRGLASDQSDTETATLLLGWAISQEQHANARSWMWLRFARHAQTAAPVWGQSQVALQFSDTLTMDRLLTRSSDAMPIYNRYDTAYALGHEQQALDIAFKGMAQNGGDEPLHDRFRQHAPGKAGYVQLSLRQENAGIFDRSAAYLEGRWTLTPTLGAVVGWSRARQSSSDPDLESIAPGGDALEQLGIQWGPSREPGELSIFHRNESRSYIGLHVAQTYRWGARLSVEGGLDYRADSSISIPLQVAGYEHNAYTNVNYLLDKRVYLRASPRLSQYYTQFGDYLGSAQIVDLEAGYRFRIDYPDWRARAVLTQQDFKRDGSLSAESLSLLSPTLQANIASGAISSTSYFIPDSNTSGGICVSMGDNVAGQSLQTVYSRAWRPYLDMCLRENSKTGSGYASLFGIAGSLWGKDHLSLQLQNSEGLSNNDGPSRILTLRYRNYF